MPKKIERTNAKWLSISEIARLWARETEKSAQVYERELIEWYQGCHFEIDPREFGHQWVDADLEDLWEPKGIDPSILVPREYLRIFCERQGLRLPKFWFSQEPNLPSFPGRPSIMSAIEDELKRRANKGELKVTLADQARTLETWASKQFPTSQTPKARSIENAIRKLYREFKHAPRN